MIKYSVPRQRLLASLVIDSSNEDLVSTYHVPDTALGDGNTSVNKRKMIPPLRELPVPIHAFILE